MNKIKRLFATMFLAVVALATNAQTAVGAKPETQDFMRSNGKIYVVMAVILIILTGFFAYLVSVDRKISKLEKN
ncbi:CcmD family protein [Parasediminibacterium sp. JCM 36343]|uniref:CcmD family protein n=1 Tax=Parasediminibacterium sp. JCM 36343 TaxID=3374279 RepID=UPI00397C9EB4